MVVAKILCRECPGRASVMSREGARERRGTSKSNATSHCAGVGYGIGGFGDPEFQATTATWGGLVGFGIFGAVMYWAREYILYLVKE